jgi:hypothetical protein
MKSKPAGAATPANPKCPDLGKPEPSFDICDGPWDQPFQAQAWRVLQILHGKLKANACRFLGQCTHLAELTPRQTRWLESLCKQAGLNLQVSWQIDNSGGLET